MHRLILLTTAGILCAPLAASATPYLGPEVLVQAGGVPIQVNEYSVPQLVDFNADGRLDLLVGEKFNSYVGKVRVYLNSGLDENPVFTSFSYVQSAGSDLIVGASGCQGAYPRAVFWDADDLIDLVIGKADGTISLYLNQGTASDPAFGSGLLLQVGATPPTKADIDVGMRAAPVVLDWNDDGRKDLLAGAYDGKIHVFLNQGTDTQPDFQSETFVQATGGDLCVETYRASPTVVDWDGDGLKDLVIGDTNGQLRLYCNTNTDADPLFAGYELLEDLSGIIDLPGSARSRPCVCDWSGDGMVDVLVGGYDGYVRLYQGVPEPATIGLLLAGAVALSVRRRA